jgi:hypothetical protein
VLYHEKWLHVIWEAVSYQDIWAKDYPVQYSRYRSVIHCKTCGHPIDSDVVISLLRRLGAGLESYTDVETLFVSPCSGDCKHPEGIFSPWRRLVEEHIANIPPFNGQPLPPTESATQRHVTN